jgi:hypothetical protein
MQNLQNLVATFHEKFGHPCFSDVNFDTLRSKAVAELRLSLLKEEIEEGVTAEAILDDDDEDEDAKVKAFIEIFDALLDVAVITLGTACVYGLKLDSTEASEETLSFLDNTGGNIFSPLQEQFHLLQDNLDALWSYPNTKSYLASAVLRNLQDMLDMCVATAHLLNLPFEEGFVEVMASNMSKLGEDGNPIYREDGKILKGPNYFKPDLGKIVNAHIDKLS